MRALKAFLIGSLFLATLPAFAGPELERLLREAIQNNNQENLRALARDVRGLSFDSVALLLKHVDREGRQEFLDSYAKGSLLVEPEIFRTLIQRGAADGDPMTFQQIFDTQFMKTHPMGPYRADNYIYEKVVKETPALAAEFDAGLAEAMRKAIEQKDSGALEHFVFRSREYFRAPAQRILLRTHPTVATQILNSDLPVVRKAMVSMLNDRQINPAGQAKAKGEIVELLSDSEAGRRALLNAVEMEPQIFHLAPGGGGDRSLLLNTVVGQERSHRSTEAAKAASLTPAHRAPLRAPATFCDSFKTWE